MAELVLVVDIADAAAADLDGQLASCGFRVRSVRDFGAAAAILDRQAPAAVVIRAGERHAADYAGSLWTLAGAPLAVVIERPLATAIERDTTELIVSWLDAGADTVLTCPLSKRELCARIRAVFGRNGAAKETPLRHRQAAPDAVRA